MKPLTHFICHEICETCKCKYMLMTWSAFCGGSTKRICYGWILRLANQEQSLNTFMNTNNYNSKFWLRLNIDNVHIHGCLQCLQKITLMKVIVINNFCIVRQKKTWHKMCIHKISKGSNSLAWILSDLVVVDIIFLMSRI